MKEPIIGFTGEYEFLDNDFILPYPISTNGYIFDNVTQAFLVVTTSDSMAQNRIAKASNPSIARSLARMSKRLELERFLAVALKLSNAGCSKL